MNGPTILNAGSRGSYSPLDLAPTAWWWAKVTNSLKQLSTGATAVTALADPVGYLGDLSGNANHLIQAVAGSRFSYQPDGIAPGIASARSDGGDDYLAVASGLGLSGDDVPFSLIISYVNRNVVDATVRTLVAVTSTLSSNPRFSFSTVQTGYRPSRRGATSGTITPLAGLPVQDRKEVLEVYFSGQAITTVVNGGVVHNSVSLDTDLMTVNTFSLGAFLTLGVTPANFISADIRQIVLAAGRVLSDAEKSDNRNWFCENGAFPVA